MLKKQLLHKNISSRCFRVKEHFSRSVEGLLMTQQVLLGWQVKNPPRSLRQSPSRWDFPGERAEPSYQAADVW